MTKTLIRTLPLLALLASGAHAQSPTMTAPQFKGSTSGVTVLQAAPTASGTVTLPATTDTLVGKNTTDTLTNKSISSDQLQFTPTSPATITRTARDKLDDLVNPKECGAANDGVTDDTTAIDTCATKAMTQGKALYLTGSYGVTTVNWHPSAGQTLVVVSNANFVGLGPKSTYASLLDVGNQVKITGGLKLLCQAKPAYAAGAWLRSPSGAAAQYGEYHGVGFDTCAASWRIGDPAFPGAINSENTIVGGWNYNTPVGVDAYGWNTYVSFVSPQFNSTSNGWFNTTSATSVTIASSGSQTITVGTGLTIPVGTIIELRSTASPANFQEGTVTSYTSGTGSLTFTKTIGFGVGSSFSAWKVTPRIAGVISNGATVAVSGGELGIPGEIGRLVSLRPALNSGSKDQYGKVFLSGVTMETASTILSDERNTANTVETSPAGVLSMVGNTGFVSQDLGAAFNTSSSFAGNIILRNNYLFSPVARSNVNVNGGGASTTVTVGGEGIGPNFRTDLAAYNNVNLSSETSLLVTTSGNAFIGAGATNNLGVGRIAAVNAASGSSSAVQAQINGGAGVAMTTDGSSYGQFITTGNYPLLLGSNNVARYAVTTDNLIRPFQSIGTVAALPTCNGSIAGARGNVSDSSVTTFGSNVAGGGANVRPVYCNGTAWIVG